jgi:hypothetical protein
MLRLIMILVVFLVLAGSVNAQVTVVRGGEENPVMTIAKSTFWGGLTGLVLGGATALVVDDNEDDVMKWFFVGGVFGGFGFGVYHVLSRPQPSSAMIQMDGSGTTLGFPTLILTRKQDASSHGLKASLTLLSFSF